MAAPRSTSGPHSTYRLQLTESFDLYAAARTLPYLHELGVDWVYLSPLLHASAGSEHGYDVVDPSRVDPARGGAEGLAALSAEARRLGMGVIVDVVPNHMGVADPFQNLWWADVLAKGQASPYAGAFDIDWAAGGGRLLLPVVGDDDLLPHGRIANLRVGDGELRYHDQRFPLAEGTSDAGDADEVHARQHYELVGWRRADTDLNYRRFFAVNTLAGVRVEDPEWFRRTHAEIGRWFDDGLVDGLRVDHPDGLRDPRGYLDDLARLTGGAYVVVEKILALRDAPSGGSSGTVVEELPVSWATAGTTGYDALALIDRVLVDPAGEGALGELDARLRGGAVAWGDLVHSTKREVADGALGSEVRRIARELTVVSTGLNPRVSTSSTTGIIDAVAELLACFPVYRSYLPEGGEHLAHAVAEARRRRTDLGEVLDAVAPVLADPQEAPALRFQQTSGMVMAKGVEDCAFYRESRLTSLNEVGGDPDVFAMSSTEFHRAMAHRQENRPDAMTASSTHDTKRAEDVRARINVLAELTDRWAETLDRLLSLVPVPDPGFGNLLWQAVVGAWPASRERLHAYAEKAMREAGARTTWTAVDSTYEAAVHAAVDASFDNPEVRKAIDGLVEDLAGPGWGNALAAKLLTLTVPGVPDVYQGSELWEQSLVDPDNRRPVDFGERATLLEKLGAGERPATPMRESDDAILKLLVTHVGLTARRDRPELFTGYTPLMASGPAADHVLAFDRGGAVSVVTRLPVGLAHRGGWDDTSLVLPAGTWRDLFTDAVFRTGDVPLGRLLETYPVALLVAEPA